MTPRLDVKPIAAEIADVIVQGDEDLRLEWSGADRVRVLVKDFIPEATPETTRLRRRRFEGELYRRIAPLGWRRVEDSGPLMYDRPGGDPFKGIRLR